jgi:hypothetical protein
MELIIYKVVEVIYTQPLELTKPGMERRPSWYKKHCEKIVKESIIIL